MSTALAVILAVKNKLIAMQTSVVLAPKVMVATCLIHVSTGFINGNTTSDHSADEASSHHNLLGTFLRIVLVAKRAVPPRVINVEKNPAYPKAVGKHGNNGTLLKGCKLRRVK